MDGSDLGWYLSTSGASEGGARSVTPIVSGVSNNVFPDVSNSSRLAGGVLHRKIFLANNHAIDAYAAHSIWIPVQPSRCEARIGLGFDDAEDDDAAAGGLTVFSGAARLALISDAADSRSVTVYGLVGGVPTAETIVLAGAAQVLSVATFDAGSPWALHTTLSASRTITIREGAGGPTRGSIGIGAVSCFAWLAAPSKLTGLRLPALASGGEWGIWERVTWVAGALPGAQNLPLATEGL